MSNESQGLRQADGAGVSVPLGPVRRFCGSKLGIGATAMTGLHYPDNLYADHEERKARARQTPVGAYRAPTEMPESERKLRTALAYVNHARDLIREALGDNEPKQQREAKIAYDVATEEGRTPRWHPDYVKAPNCDGLSAREIRAPHPMQAEAIRDHDERLAGGEDRL